MCGIAGALGAQRRGLAETMISAIDHRGPDGRGAWLADRAELAVARLSIVDPQAPAAPLENEAGTIRLAFNGEIYNHRQLRAELEGRGHRFATRTDSEVVVHLYEELGAACVLRLRGMFAFAILDGDRLLLARDRLGIKPLYYADLAHPGLFVFASEIKALLRCDELEPRLDLQSLADALVLGHSVSTRTSIEAILSLAAGHTMIVEKTPNGVRVGEQVPYFDRFTARNEGISYEEAEQMLDETLSDTVDCHLAADVEVGIALSGGIDSTMLALMAATQDRAGLKTFAIGDYPRNPDLLVAARVANAIGSEHSSIVLTFDDYLAAIPRFVATEEHPSTLVGMPFFLLSEHISGSVKACLCGEGADEIFGGYAEYLHRDAKLASLSRRLPVLERLGVGLSDEAAEVIACLTSARAYDEYLAALFDINLGAPLERLHLHGVDKNAMAHGLEMRVPYLDDRVYALVTSLPLWFRTHAELGIRKYILRRLFLRRFGQQHVDVVLREKLGAPSSGVQLVLRFDDLCDAVLPDDYLDRHELGFCFATKRQLLAFEMFEEIFLRGKGDVDALGNVLDYMQERTTADVAGAAA
jgi:asparagine synthase (glutamine-hydrolysing)